MREGRCRTALSHALIAEWSAASAPLSTDCNCRCASGAGVAVGTALAAACPAGFVCVGTGPGTEPAAFADGVERAPTDSASHE